VKFIDSTKSILENIYLASGPIIALLSFFIFRQIKLAKEQLHIAKRQLIEAQKQLMISSKRDSIKLAADQIHFFSTVVVANFNILHSKLEEKGVKPIRIPTKKFAVDDVFTVLQQKTYLEYTEKIVPFIPDYLNVVNNIETFAAYFIQEVADEKVAFHSCGGTFCSVVEKCSFIICIGNIKKHETPFFNTIKLYNIWCDRLQTEGIKIQKEMIEKELKEKIEKIDEALKTKDDFYIKPLGTE